ncbi:uncharacterized protein DUF1376 [Pseudoduganella lurida]|uniref:Uncharacterized protein DUF1376 n=1 Tax=Pseudoduganella lurida TaxID=1036180 RepID=A0A562RIX6_9BURK|nr:DUF1376 domain-containing protein [Pseudoduganella lurida]TWI69039.1 uncharacterized protein DUF1376 [Pseudoduganella lurida]
MNPADLSALAAPLTPADCNLQDFAFMPLDVVRLRDSDLAVTAEADEFRCAVLLWCAAWHQVPAASLPDDDKVLAQYAGYGRVVKAWQKVRAGALRGWIKCADGRLYHPVVAEKANEAWMAKLRQRLKTECARIKKHNERHGTSIPFPDFDSWLSSGCPTGQPLFVPSDKPKVSQGQTRSVTGEKQSKGQGEGQGQLTTNPESGGSSDSTREDYDDDRLPPRPTLAGVDPSMRAVAIATLLTGAGVRKVTAFHPDVAVTWAQDERVTDVLLLDAVKRARESLGDEPFHVPYLKPIVVELLNPPPPKPAKPKADDWAWKRSNQGIDAKGRELGLFARGGETYPDFAARIQAAIDKRKEAA